MRKDMKDIIIEAPRMEDLDNPRGRMGQRDPETLPEKEGMRRRYTGWGPILGDRLTPLVRFLRSRCGQKWDKVFSEMCEHADLRTLRGKHLREHIEMEVHQWSEREAQAGLRWPRWRRFYVDRGGFLREESERRWKYRRPTPDPDKCMIGDARFERINGCWFQVWYTEESVPHRRWDFLTQKHVVDYVTKEVRECQKQLNTKELRDLGLSNEPGWLWYAA